MKNGEWKWKNFKPSEVACKGKTCGCDAELWAVIKCASKKTDEPPEYFMKSMDTLQKLRDAWGKAIFINSAHRCENHNKRVGGAKASRHMLIAFDCVMEAYEQDKFADLARKCGFNGIGLYPNRSFVHLDIRENSAIWIK